MSKDIYNRFLIISKTSRYFFFARFDIIEFFFSWDHPYLRFMRLKIRYFDNMPFIDVCLYLFFFIYRCSTPASNIFQYPDLYQLIIITSSFFYVRLQHFLYVLFAETYQMAEFPQHHTFSIKFSNLWPAYQVHKKHIQFFQVKI